MGTERELTVVEIWSYGTDLPTSGLDLSGYRVDAVDGHIGKVDEATYDAGGSYLVVDTGPWIFGHKVMLPAGVINGIDPESETVYVSRTKDEIKNAPPLEESDRYDEQRKRLGDYYAGFEAPGERPGVGLDRTVRQG